MEELLKHLDFQVNIPTLIAIGSIGMKAYHYVSRIAYKIDTMWERFLIDHPEYERREKVRFNR